MEKTATQHAGDGAPESLAKGDVSMELYRPHEPPGSQTLAIESIDRKTLEAPRANMPVRLETLTDVLKLGDVLARSGFFDDVRDAAQAVVKILAGAEYGIGPIAAMRSVHVFDGKTELSASLIGALIKKHPRYDFHVRRCTPEGCEIAFFEAGPDGSMREAGTASFTMEDARRAGLARKSNWQKYPEDMCFARAMTRGARRFCSVVFGGSIYAAGEIDGTTGDDTSPHGSSISRFDEEVGAPAAPALPPAERKLSKPQAQRLHIKLSRLGLGDGYDFAGYVLSREAPASLTELTAGEAASVFERAQDKAVRGQYLADVARAEAEEAAAPYDQPGEDGPGSMTSDQLDAVMGVLASKHDDGLPVFTREEQEAAMKKARQMDERAAEGYLENLQKERDRRYFADDAPFEDDA